MAVAGDIDREELLDCVLVHTSRRIREFLGRASMAKSGTKDVLRERLAEYLDGGPRRVVELTEFLNQIEGWGNQHLYLYTAPTKLNNRWRNEQHIVDVAARAHAKSILNSPRPVVLPDKPTLSSFTWTAHHLRLIWNEKRTWSERREDKDTESTDGKLEFRAWEQKTARGTLAFDWDLRTGAAMLMIQRLPSGTDYQAVKDAMTHWLEPFVDLAAFTAIRVSDAIESILRSNEVRERRTNWETVIGGKAVFTSPHQHQGVGSDQTLQSMLDAGGNDLRSSLGNMYWLPGNGRELDHELHTVILKKDQRVAISGERVEREVRHVTGRIRAHCQ